MVRQGKSHRCYDPKGGMEGQGQELMEVTSWLGTVLGQLFEQH